MMFARQKIPGEIATLGTTDKLVIVISATSSLVAGLAAAFYMSWDMGLVLTCIVPLVILNLFGSAYVSCGRLYPTNFRV
jgi:hypothetical protein